MTTVFIVLAILFFVLSIIMFRVHHVNIKADTRGKINIEKENEKNARSAQNWAVGFTLLTLVCVLIIFFRIR